MIHADRLRTAIRRLCQGRPFVSCESVPCHDRELWRLRVSWWGEGIILAHTSVKVLFTEFRRQLRLKGKERCPKYQRPTSLSPQHGSPW